MMLLLQVVEICVQRLDSLSEALNVGLAKLGLLPRLKELEW
jgi:hypothetical protein